MEIIMWVISMMNPTHPYALITLGIMILGFILSAFTFAGITVYFLKHQLRPGAM